MRGGVCVRRTATVERPTSYHDLDVPFAGFGHRSGRHTAPLRHSSSCLFPRKKDVYDNKRKKGKGVRQNIRLVTDLC